MVTAILWTGLLIAALGYFGWQLWGRFSVLLKARRDDGRKYDSKTLVPRLKQTLIYAFGQKKFFRDDQPAGVMHIIIFWGFVTLLFQVITMFGRGWDPEFRIPLFGVNALGGPYGFAKDIFEVAVWVAVSIGLFRWAVVRPTRLFGFLPAEKRLSEHSHWEAYLILIFISAIMASGLFYDAGRMAAYAATNPEIAAEMHWQPVSAALSRLFASNPELGLTISNLSWWVHNLVILCFLNLLPRSKHFHIITAIPNVFFGKVEPKGRLAKRDFTVENPLFGRSTPDQFTAKQVLDMYSCTECGRCSTNCPATATGKPLAPRQFLVDLRNTIYANQTKLAMAKTGTDGAAGEVTFEPVVAEDKPISDEVVWSCLECRACEEACPVNIEYVDKIVDIRQHLVQEASRFPAELNRAFKGMETQSNPWGISSAERTTWADGFDVPTLMEKPDAEYLYYVGCGGSFDSNNRKATQSFVRILKEAGVSFAILGQSETCNGDSARRLGNEYLYQTLAEQLSNTLKENNVKKILVNCPHCFNTLKNEYPDFGGDWEVTHAAALVGKLINDGKVKIDTKKSFDKKVVYHDSCYYGRFNDIYDEPRNLINQVPGAQLGEMERCKEKGMCCGAGGGRMWMEEKADQRVNLLRTDQALESKPDVIATSCPYCRIMIGSGINEKGLADKVGVMDVMEIVAASIAESKEPTQPKISP